MARRTMKHAGQGQMGLPPTLRVEDDGKISVIMIAALNSFLQSVARTLNNISMGNGAQATKAGAMDAQWIEWYFADADTEARIPHDLDRVPAGYSVERVSKAATIYTSNIGGWGPDAIYLMSSAGDTTVRLLLK
jgi:hypothetical protein